mmetsp:Transcript_24260/g.21405  ORF Transcript_24260/g.21405 Transcript_24260/m.21405 type:complete len:130 (-) Transcript_24260:746-1135(-)
MEELENQSNIKINQEAMEELQTTIKSALKKFQENVLVEDTKERTSLDVKPFRYRFSDYIETKHSEIQNALINISKHLMFLTADTKGLVTFWDSKNLEQIRTQNLKKNISNFEFDPVEDRIIIAYGDNGT